MKKQYLLLCSLLAASLMLFSGFTPSDSGRKLKPVEEKQVERYTIDGKDFEKCSVGSRSELWEQLEFNNMAVKTDSPFDSYQMPTLESLEDNSSDIVIGYFDDDIFAIRRVNGINSITSYVTASYFHVRQTFKGNLKAGDIITIGDLFQIRTVSFGKMLVAIGDYVPSRSGKDYFLFLNQLPRNDPNMPNGYELTNSSENWKFARYPILTPEQKTRGMKFEYGFEYGVYSISTDYASLYNEVAEKYGI